MKFTSMSSGWRKTLNAESGIRRWCYAGYFGVKYGGIVITDLTESEAADAFRMTALLKSYPKPLYTKHE